MDILIKGMDMPKQMESPITITIFKNGSVWMNDVTFGKGKLPNAKAVALPEHHGRLKDADAIISKIERMVHPDDLTYTIAYGILKQIVEDAETIVEATE